MLRLVQIHYRQIFCSRIYYRITTDRILLQTLNLYWFCTKPILENIASSHSPQIDNCMIKYFGHVCSDRLNFGPVVWNSLSGIRAKLFLIRSGGSGRFGYLVRKSGLTSRGGLLDKRQIWFIFWSQLWSINFDRSGRPVYQILS